MSSQLSESPRRGLSRRQAETVERLLVAGAEELREAGVEGLTIRSVASRAGVSPATAYTYFASREHLFAQLFWHHLLAHPAPSGGTTDGVVERLRAVTRSMATMLADSPEMAAAATKALLASDPDIDRLRTRIGAEFLRRFEVALGDSADPRVLDTLMLAFSGAMLQAGMGVFTYTEMGDRLDAVVAVVMEGLG